MGRNRSPIGREENQLDKHRFDSPEKSLTNRFLQSSKHRKIYIDTVFVLFHGWKMSIDRYFFFVMVMIWMNFFFLERNKISQYWFFEWGGFFSFGASQNENRIVKKRKRWDSVRCVVFVLSLFSWISCSSRWKRRVGVQHGSRQEIRFVLPLFGPPPTPCRLRAFCPTK